MIWIKNKIIPFKGFNAITIWPFVFYRKDVDLTTRNHENIHGAQQAEIGLIFGFIVFYIWYYIEYRYRYKILRKVGMSKKYAKAIAYEIISFEQEAYKYESDYMYLKNRKLFSWLKYFKKYD